jgi:hypothetical protein
MGETALCPSQMPVATMAIDETASCPSRIPVAVGCTHGCSSAMSDLTAALSECGLSPCFVDKFIDESGFSSVEDLALAEREDLLECLCAIGVRPMKSKVTVQRMAALAEPVVPFSLRDGSTTALPQPMPPVPASTSLSVDAGPSALRPAITPVLLLLPGCEMEPSPSVDTLASQPVTVASLLPPSVVIADTEHPSPGISGPLDAVAPVPLSPRVLRDLRNIIARSFFNFSCGSCADLRASARCDWLSGCSVDSFSAGVGFDWTPERYDAVIRLARLPPPDETHSTILLHARHALTAQCVSVGLGDIGCVGFGQGPGSLDLGGGHVIHQDEAWFTLGDEMDVRLSALVGRYIALRRFGRVEAVSRAADLVSAYTASAVSACATLSLRHMLHVHSRHPSRHPAPCRRRDCDAFGGEIDSFGRRARDGSGAVLWFVQMKGGYEQALWLRCAAAPLLSQLAAKAAAATVAAAPKRQGRQGRDARKRVAAATKDARFAAICWRDHPQAQFLEAIRIAQEEVMSCVLSARAQSAESRRAASSVAYRAAAVAAGVAAGAAIMAHEYCDIVDYCLSLRAQCERQRDTTCEWRAMEHEFSDDEFFDEDDAAGWAYDKHRGW